MRHGNGLPFAASVDRPAMIRIGEAVRELREERGITLRALAKTLNLSPPFLSDLEHGRRRMPRVEDFANALGVKPRHFYDLAGWCPHCDGTGYAVGGADRRSKVK